MTANGTPVKTSAGAASPNADLEDADEDADDARSMDCLEVGSELPFVPMRPLKVRRCGSEAWIQMAKDCQAIDSIIGKGHFESRYPVPACFRQGPAKDGGYVNRDGFLVLPNMQHDEQPDGPVGSMCVPM